MEALAAPKHRERILMALSQVPIATTKQISSLNQSLDPRKKASSILRELEKEKIIRSAYHRQEKIWRLTRKGRKLQQITPTKLPTKIDHALAVINLYFTINPSRWMYEPKEAFEEGVWTPDCIFAFNRKVYVCEVQLTAMSQKKWEAKWSHFNAYFNGGYFVNAAFQAWSNKTIYPQFLCITCQQSETAKNGFDVNGRELIVCREFKS